MSNEERKEFLKQLEAETGDNVTGNGYHFSWIRSAKSLEEEKQERLKMYDTDEWKKAKLIG